MIGGEAGLAGGAAGRSDRRPFGVTVAVRFPAGTAPSGFGAGGHYDRLVLVLAVLFLVVPFAEIYVLLQVGHAIGVLDTIALLILVSVIGGWLVKREGLSVLRRAQTQLEAGRVPAVELVDGILVVAAGALLITPGFLTDLAGIVVLLPPVRAVIRGWARRRWARRLAIQRGIIDL